MENLTPLDPYDAKDQRIEQLNAENKLLRSRCSHLETDLRRAKSATRKRASEARAAKESIRYRIGTAFIDAVSSPEGFVKLPVRLFRLWKQERRKAKEAALLTKADKQTATLDDPFDAARHTITSFQYHTFESDLAALAKRGVTIVVPVYNAFEELQLCVESVLRNTAFPFRLLLIDDCSSDERVLPWMREQEKLHPMICVIAHEKNVGFVRTANDGMRAADGDVVLLNSDCIVTPNWLKKLAIAAYQEPNVATVTPFSNAAGAFSVPDDGVNGDIPICTTLDSMARLVERCSACKYVHVPTGNGFCLYVRRAAIEKIGYLDAETFGMGYGEENDFCMRAVQNNMVNLTCNDCYVFHKREASFKENKKALIEKNAKILDRRYHTYRRDIRIFSRDEQLCAFRSRVEMALCRAESVDATQKRRILYVLHDGRGGTPQTNADLMEYVDRNLYEPYLLICNGFVMRLFYVVGRENIELKTWKLSAPWSVNLFRSEEYRDIYFDVLRVLHIQLVHVRHLFKHSLFDIADVCNALQIPILLSFHDFYFICPIINLINSDMRYCDTVCREKDKCCHITSGLIDVGDTNAYTQTVWQPAVREVLGKCDGFVTTTQHTRDTYLKIYPEIAARFYVIEHGRDFDYERVYRGEAPNGRKARVLLAGNISESKGSGYVAELCALDKEQMLEFHCIGKSSSVTDALLGNRVIFHGEYAREDFAKKVEEIKPAYIAILSICPETYCHILTEAFSCGIPCIVSNLGALRERGLRMGGVILVDINDARSGYEKIVANICNPQAYETLKEQACTAPYQSIAQMGASYLPIYEKTLHPMADAMIYLYCAGQAYRDYFASTWIRVIRPLLMNRCIANHAAVCVVHTLEELPQELPLPMRQYVVLQRDHFSQADLQLLTRLPVRVVYETDDDLAASSSLSADEAKVLTDRIDEAVDMAETVLTTTNELAIRLNAPQKTTVIPNYADERLWLTGDHACSQRRNDSIRVVYMGTKTYVDDLKLLKEPFLSARKRLEQEQNTTAELYVVGVTQEKDDWYHGTPKPPSRYVDFVKWLRMQRYDVALAPLVLDSDINKAKSYLKYLDYACLRLPAIFSPISAYRKVIHDGENGILVASNAENDWENAIYKLLSNKALREDISSVAYQDVVDHYLLKNHENSWSNAILGSVEQSD